MKDFFSQPSLFSPSPFNGLHKLFKTVLNKMQSLINLGLPCQAVKLNFVWPLPLLSSLELINDIVYSSFSALINRDTRQKAYTVEQWILCFLFLTSHSTNMSSLSLKAPGYKNICLCINTSDARYEKFQPILITDTFLFFMADTDYLWWDCKHCHWD